MYECNKFHKVFVLHCNPWYHQWVHPRVKPVLCNQFVKVFVYYNSLWGHERTATEGESMSIKNLVRSLANKLTFSYTTILWWKKKADTCQQSVQAL